MASQKFNKNLYYFVSRAHVALVYSLVPLLEADRYGFENLRNFIENSNVLGRMHIC